MKTGDPPRKNECMCVYDYSYLHLNTLDCVDYKGERAIEWRRLKEKEYQQQGWKKLKSNYHVYYL